MSQNPSTLLLCTDLDRTLLPNGPQPESAQARAAFRRVADQPWIKLAYVSGRYLSLVEDAIDEYQLPKPDYVVTDVGTRIHHHADGDWQPWPEWETEISPGWPGRDPLFELFQDLPELRLQEAGKQSAFKLSYYLPMGADFAALDRHMRERLRGKGFEVNLTWSLDEPAELGLLDVLPTGATKLHAVEYLRTSLQLPRERVLFAGDSGNDLPALSSALPAVLVANASAEVKRQAQDQAREAGTEDRLYLARGDSLGMNGNYAAGIVEGLFHYHPEIGDC